jgi:hypothetical protein
MLKTEEEIYSKDSHLILQNFRIQKGNHISKITQPSCKSNDNICCPHQGNKQ